MAKCNRVVPSRYETSEQLIRWSVESFAAVYAASTAADDRPTG